MCDQCIRNYSYGHLSPRLWKCGITDEIKGFSEVREVIEKHANKENLYIQNVSRTAYNFLKIKHAKAKESNAIYLEEDYFIDDLINHFKMLSMPSPPRLRQVLNDKDEIKLEHDNNWDMFLRMIGWREN